MHNVYFVQYNFPHNRTSDIHLIYFKLQIEDSVDLLPSCLEPLGVDVRISCEDQSQDVAGALERGLWFC